MGQTQVVLPPLEEEWSDRVWNKMSGGFRKWRLKRAQSGLEHELAQIVETANGHQAKKLPAGHPVYAELLKQANARIDTFCKDWSIDRVVIEKEAPALRELEALTHPPSPAAGLFKGVGAMIAVAIGAVLVGCTGGLISSGYHWVVVHLCH